MEEDELNFEIHDNDGDPVRADVHIVCRDMLGEIREIDGTSSAADGGVTLPVPSMSTLEYVVVQGEGFWTFHSKDAEDFETLTLIPLPELDEPAWWLRALNIDAADAQRGSGITIAVVDADFRPGFGLEEIAGGMEGSEDGRGWGHGEMVCRILCDRQPASVAYYSAAPGADVIFADATGQEGGVDPALAISAIFELVSRGDVHIISLSWGDGEEFVGIRNVVKFASEMGVTVLAASGNDATDEQPLYPARSPDCIGVGAFGMCGWGHLNTMAGWYDNPSPRSRGKVPNFGPIFAWSDCTFGKGMDTIGPGVGILVRRNNRVSFDLSGTSFATPLVAGVLAIALSKDRTYLSLPRTSARTKYARGAFEAMCQRTGLPQDREGFGVPRLPRRQ